MSTPTVNAPQNNKAKASRVVAELGRPETAEETAARKAENSRKHRAKQTINNLVLSLLATLAVVVVIVLIVPRSDKPIDRAVDWSAAAAQWQPTVDVTLMNPTLSPDWVANSAQFSTDKAGIASWYIALLSPEKQFVGIHQGIDADATWLAGLLDGNSPVSTAVIDGITWDVYSNPKPLDERGLYHYALVTEAGRSTIVLLGEAGPEVFDSVATDLAPDVRAAQEDAR
ncbi:DUF4245 family protein [Microterricola viridarii]|uniref:DUF4245 domain-containing protein n=1 Tax=Microterricola viridarii TaxID=412690 RepID=A0A0X8E3U9_9MICO|nr:DUF4245 family protein [Microterricola viridarii]AMB59052.1 hypothetical protein AWU67_09505 [Microterricola viridarii]